MEDNIVIASYLLARLVDRCISFFKKIAIFENKP